MNTLSLPHLALVATGGTIAGTGGARRYTAATLDAAALHAAVPELAPLAHWQIEQLFSLDSRDMAPCHWLGLAARVQQLIDSPEIDGVIITHGTDTLEETAFALHLLLTVRKPVVLTAAMRPADCADADGPRNLLDACRTALLPGAAEQGVLVLAQGRIISGSHLGKMHTCALDALRPQPPKAECGHVGEAGASFCSPPPAQSGPYIGMPASPSLLPRVDILYACAGVCAAQLDSALDTGARGLVLALAGHGSIPAVWRKGIQRARREGVPVIRASRVASGGVHHGHNEDDDTTGCIAAERLSAQQARVLVILALASMQEAKLQTLFACL